MPLLSWLALITLAVQPPEPAVARELNLPTGTYDSVTRSAMLDQTLPAGSIRIRIASNPEWQKAELRLRSFVQEYGWRCTGDTELTILPAQNDTSILTRFARAPGRQPIIEGPGEVVFSTGNTVGTAIREEAAVILFACRVTNDPSGLLVLPMSFTRYRGEQPYLLTADVRGELRWCAANGQVLRSVNAMSASLITYDVSHDGTLVALAGYDPLPTVKVYAGENGTLRQTLNMTRLPFAVVFSGDGRSLLTVDEGGLTQYRVSDGQVIARLNAPLTQPSGTAGRAWTGGGANAFLEVRAGNDHRVYTLGGSGGTARLNPASPFATLTRDGAYHVTGRYDGTIVVRDARAPEKITHQAVGGLTNLLMVIPGRTDREVLLFGRASRLPNSPDYGRIRVSAYTIGDPTPKALPDVMVPNGHTLVMDERANFTSLAACRREGL